LAQGSRQKYSRFPGSGMPGCALQERTSFSNPTTAALGTVTYIQYLDGDDLLAPDKIERQLAFLRQQPLGTVSCCEWTRFYQDPAEGQFTPQALWQDATPIDWLICAWEQHLMMHGATWLIPSSVIQAAGEWDESLTLINDFEYFSRVVLASKHIRFCWGAKTYYRSGLQNSVSGRKSEVAWQSAFYAINRGTQHLLNQEDSPRTRQVCANVFQRFIYEAYPAVPSLRQRAQQRVQQLGGATERPIGGPLFSLLTRLFGWQLAKLTKERLYRYGYERWRAKKSSQSTVHETSNNTPLTA
ncbi:MAG: hypothetical protein AAFU71_10590, partial [Cyanobacteria bacterium J06632_22]